MWHLTDEQSALRDKARGVVLDEIRPRVLEHADCSDYPPTSSTCWRASTCSA